MVAREIRPFLAIVMISKAEQEMLDNSPAYGGKGWKYTMPDGWDLESGDVFARLTGAGIAFEPPVVQLIAERHSQHCQ